MISDPVFYLAAIPAVILFGIAKGGFGGGLGVIAVPLMSLVVSPLTAAAILLPILCFMDLISARVYWRRWSWPDARLLIPASVVGIAAGWAGFEYLNEAIIKLIVGLVAISFALHYYLSWGSAAARRLYGPVAGAAAGSVAGFTSFVAHAGGPPVNMYLLRRPLDKTAFVGTTVLFFAAVNYMKLVPYWMLGQFDGRNLMTSAALMLPAAFGVLAGAWLHRRISDRFFYQLVYVLLLAVGLKLGYDGLAGVGVLSPRGLPAAPVD